MTRTRSITTVLALLALSGGALALSQPERAGQPGQRSGQPGQRGGQPGQRDPAQFVERMMQRDANGDGKLSRDELPEQLAERFFATADANDDGVLDREELAASLSRRGQQGRPGGQAGGAQPNFEGSMRQAGRAMAGLMRSEFTGETMQRDLQSVQMLQQALLGAKGGVSNAPRSERAQQKYRSDDSYRAAMRMNLLNALRETITLEMAILEGKESAAKDLVRKISEIQEKAHGLFQPEHEDDHDDGR